jgi:hypothetical protein
MSISPIMSSGGLSDAQYANLLNEVAKKARAEAGGAPLPEGVIVDRVEGSPGTVQPVLQLPGDVQSPLADWVALPSPGAVVMAFITADAAEQRKINRELVHQQTEAIAQNIELEAETMREKALVQLVLGIVSNVIKIGTGFAQMGVAGKAGDASLGGAKANAVGSVGGGFSGIVDSVSQYEGTMYDARIKEMEADDERMRAARDALKDLNESLNALIEKSLSTADAIQQNMNQTNARILG